MIVKQPFPSAKLKREKTHLHDVADTFAVPVRRVPNGVIVEVYPYRLLDVTPWSTPGRHPQQLPSSEPLGPVLGHVVDLWHDRVLLAPGPAPLMQYLVVDAGVAEVGILLPSGVRGFQG
jgi:hypothetical protein